MISFKKSAIFLALAALLSLTALLPALCSPNPVAPSKPSSQPSAVATGHWFQGWHRNYGNARMFITKDRAYMDNGVCTFFLSKYEPDRLIIFVDEDNAYYDMRPGDWFTEQCASRPYEFKKFKFIRKDNIQAVKCDLYECMNEEKGPILALYWTTKDFNIDPKLTAGFCRLLGVPQGCGFPLRLACSTYFDKRVNVDLPGHWQISEKQPKRTKLRSQFTFSDFAILQSHKEGTLPLKEMTLPSTAHRVKNWGTLIYGEKGEITEGSIDTFMSSPMKKK